MAIKTINSHPNFKASFANDAETQKRVREAVYTAPVRAYMVHKMLKSIPTNDTFSLSWDKGNNSFKFENNQTGQKLEEKSNGSYALGEFLDTLIKTIKYPNTKEHYLLFRDRTKIEPPSNEVYREVEDALGFDLDNREEEKYKVEKRIEDNNKKIEELEQENKKLIKQRETLTKETNRLKIDYIEQKIFEEI